MTLNISWRGKLCNCEASNNEVITNKEYLGWIACEVVFQLVKTFQQDEAILLPEVHANLCRLVSATTEQFLMCKIYC